MKEKKTTVGTCGNTGNSCENPKMISGTDLCYCNFLHYKKPVKLPSTYSACMDLYYNFHIEKVGVPPDINGLSGKSLKSIIAYITKIVIKQDEEGIIAAFKFILDQYPLWDKFYQNQLKLNQIYSNLTNIIKNIKDGKKSTSKYDQSKYR